MNLGSLASKDAITGALFVGVGLAALYLGSDYVVGTPTEMGPGFFPRALCWMLVALGTIVLFRALVAGGDHPSAFALRPLFFIMTSIVAFAALLPVLGFALASAAGVALSIAAGRDAPLLESVLLIVGLTAASAAIFIFGLGLPIPLWPRGLAF